jgi:RHS repeat-associated protein
VTSYQRYYPYGEPRDGYSSALPTDHTFTGQISDGLLGDGGTGLMYYGARYYDPQVGRFAAADTIVPNPSNPQDLNRYAYVSNNPVNGVDPSGHGPTENDWHRYYGHPDAAPALAWRIFNDMADEQDILFQYIEGGCEDRAEQMADLIADEYPDVILNKVGIVRDIPDQESLSVTITTEVAWKEEPFTQSFGWESHMAVAVEIGGETWVIDPSLFDGPVSEAQWAEAMGAFEAEVEILATSVYRYNAAEEEWSPIGPTEQERAKNRGRNAYACQAARDWCSISDAQLHLLAPDS